MNSLKYIFSLVAIMAVLVSCEKEDFDDTSFLETATSPAQLSALFDITQDNTGLVTITPNGEGASTYEVYFGDATTTPAKVIAGKSVQHIYPEGVYNVKIVGYGITGKLTEKTIQLTVSFREPENFEVLANVDGANNLKVNVSASALYETVFKVYFGDVVDEVPVSFLEGETVSHVYTTPGTYTVRVVALSGGAASKEFTKSVVIFDPVVLPLTFQSSTVNYAWNGFDGGTVTIVDNPNANSGNTSNKVAKMVKNAGQPWGGATISLTGAIDFSANKIFRMKVHSPRIGAKVLLKVENSGNGDINFEKEVLTTVANDWEDLVFDFRSINTANSYHKIVLIFDNGTMGDGSGNFTFYFDDIRLTNSIPSLQTQIDLPVTFDEPNVNYTHTDFEGAVTIDAVDPVNFLNKVKMTTKPVGAQLWAGTTVGTAAGFATVIPISANNKKMTLKVYSPAAGIPVNLKIEDHRDPTKSVETTTLTTVANTWETLVFDFANQNNGTAALNLSYNYDKASVFFDFLQTPNGKVFYWDDLQMFTANQTDELVLPLTFQSTTLNYAFTDFDGGVVTVVDNPYSSGNSSTKVGKMVKNAGQPWGGSYISLANPIDFSVNKTFTMKVYSPRVGAKVLLKVENLTDGNIGFQKEVTTTVANGWETLTFDYSAINTANSYQKVVLIFELGTVGDGSANYTFYFDDIILN